MSAAAPAPPITLALELRRGVAFADESHRQEASGWLQFALDPRTKGGMLAVLNNESLASELQGPVESSQCLTFINNSASHAFYLNCLAVLQQNGWKVQTSHAYSTSSLNVITSVIFVKDHDNVVETVRAAVRRSIKLGQLEEPVHASVSEATLTRRASAGQLDTRSTRAQPIAPVARESITIQPATPLPAEARALKRVESAPSPAFLQHHMARGAVAPPQPPPPPGDPRAHRRVESAPVQQPPPPSPSNSSNALFGSEDGRPVGRLSVKNAAAALAGTIGKVAMAPNPYAAGGPFRPHTRPQADTSQSPSKPLQSNNDDTSEKQSIDIHPTMQRPTLRTQRRSRSVADSRKLGLRSSFASLNDGTGTRHSLTAISAATASVEATSTPPPPPPPPKMSLEDMEDVGHIEDVVPMIDSHNPMFDQSGKLLLSPKSSADRQERENQFFARLKAHEEERKRQELENLEEEELQKLKVEEDAKAQREGLKTAHFARLGRPLVTRPGAKRET